MNAFEGLRVALVGPLPPPAGGMAQQTLQLAELFGREGAKVTIVQVNAPYRPMAIEGIRGVRAVFRLVPYLVALWRAAGRADIVHVMANSGWSWHLFASPAIRIAALRGVPCVVNYRGGEAEAFLARSGRSVRAALSRASMLVVPSAFLERIFARHGMVARIVANVVDLERFQPGPDRQSRTPRILIARNLEPIYDIGTALRAFARVCMQAPQARLLVAGSGPELAPLRALADALGVASGVEFCGRLDREAMARRYREATIAVNPSRVDNMPNSVLEAMASGVPVVSTNVGGVPYIVRDGLTGILVPAGDPEAMAAAILHLVDDPALAERLRGAALAEVQRYSWERLRDEWAAVYAASRQGSRVRMVAA